jgi:Ribbon-helix-helix protein, copG family
VQRTNIYLDDDQVRALKHLAAEERKTVASLVRQAVDQYLAQHFRDAPDWGQRFDALVARIQSRALPHLTPAHIEADITAARQEVRLAHTRRRAFKADAGG